MIRMDLKERKFRCDTPSKRFDNPILGDSYSCDNKWDVNTDKYYKGEYFDDRTFFMV